MGAPRHTPETRQRVLDLHRDGKSRNDIARETGVAAATVTKWVRENGGSFDRTATEAATRARKLDAAAIRAELELEYAQDAQRLRAQLWQPHTYIDHGGKDFTRVEWEQNEPTPADKLKLVQASTTALDRSLKIADHGRGTSELAVVDQWLDTMLGTGA